MHFVEGLFLPARNFPGFIRGGEQKWEGKKVLNKIVLSKFLGTEAR